MVGDVTHGDGPDVAAMYDAVAADYADRFADELDAKPGDVNLLDQFALVTAQQGPVWDVGCGSAGHITRFMADREVEVVGADISPGAVTEARRRQPDLDFRVADLRQLPVSDRSLAGIVAFYSLIHLPRPELPAALAEFRRVLKPTGALLIAMHSVAEGSPESRFDPEADDPGEIVSTEFLGHPVVHRVTLVHPRELSAIARHAGFDDVGFFQRAPYPGEYPTHRLFLRAGPDRPDYLDPEGWLRRAAGG
jgi:SAM-dependent methyltransferase